MTDELSYIKKTNTFKRQEPYFHLENNAFRSNFQLRNILIKFVQLRIVHMHVIYANL